MRSFAVALTLFAAAKAVELERDELPYQLPQYEKEYAPDQAEYDQEYGYYGDYVDYQDTVYGKDPRYTPLMHDTQKLAYVWAKPYYPDRETYKKEVAEMEDMWTEAEHIVAGVANYLEKQQTKIATEMKRLPEYNYNEVAKAAEEPEYHPEPVDPYVLPVHEVVSSYEHYCATGECELSRDAYEQAVNWKQSNYRSQPVLRKSPAYRKPYYNDVQAFTVAKVNADTGMAYLEQVYEQGYEQYPSYGKFETYTPEDLYTGTTVLPVDITDAYGQNKVQNKVVQNKSDNTKEVTITNDSTGLQNTLRLRDTQHVEHVQEVDNNYDYVDDMQLVTICDDETYVCDVIALNLDSPDLDSAYLEHVYDEVDYAQDAYPHESYGEPVIVDPASVGAQENDICWVEDVIVGTDMYGKNIVESEVFCAAGEELYVEPLSNYQEPPKAPTKPTGFPTKPKPKRAPRPQY
jgi:hypothetical protein